jgi:hypothetical protein
MFDHQVQIGVVMFTGILIGILRWIFIYRPIVRATRLYLHLHVSESKKNTRLHRGALSLLLLGGIARETPPMISPLRILPATPRMPSPASWWRRSNVRSDN